MGRHDPNRDGSVASTLTRETRRVSDTAAVILLVICVVIAFGGFATGIRLVRRVREESEEANAERNDEEAEPDGHQ
jgi:hypothetical protein